jgi:hypothetical protein
MVAALGLAQAEKDKATKRIATIIRIVYTTP